MTIETVLLNEVENTLFLTKNTLHIGKYLTGTKCASVISYSGANLEYLKKRLMVYDPATNNSSKKFFNEIVHSLKSPITQHKWKNIWSYEPYEWQENYDNTQVKIFANSFYLFRRYSNKLNQKIFFHRFANGVLKEALNKQMMQFQEKITFESNNKSFPKVNIHSHSEGGKGISIEETKRHYSCLHPVYEALFCHYDTGISQMAVVIDDDVLCFQPSRVWNGNKHSMFGASCTYYDPNIGSYCDLDKVTALTVEVGKILLQSGYRGAFGCDYLYDRKTNSFYLSEANLRYTSDVSLFCNSNKLEHGLRNLLNPHSLHILAFHGVHRVDLPSVKKSSYISFKKAGGTTKRAYFEPGSPMQSAKKKRFYKSMVIRATPDPMYINSSVFLESL